MKNIVENSRPITILSHNLWFGKAMEALPGMIREHNVDIATLQETGEELPDTIEGLRLARHDALSPHVGSGIL